ncbi:hypothetical protein BD779DRAFT_1476978 [Infundibulicybe gibba]|nr:hypothetical protein BD779DRAFT_1476978 [Infundibulicybe gibba]
MSGSSCLVLLFSALAVTAVLPYSGRAGPECVESHIGGDDPRQHMARNPSAGTADNLVDSVTYEEGPEGDREDKDDREDEGREVEININEDAEVEDGEGLGGRMDLIRLALFAFVSLCFD